MIDIDILFLWKIDITIYVLVEHQIQTFFYFPTYLLQ